MRERYDSRNLSPSEIGSLWKNNTSGFGYIDLPNLSVLTALSGYRLDLKFLDGYADLHSMGLALARLMLESERLMDQLQVSAVRLSDLSDFGEGLEGTIPSFEESFRTKNVPDFDSYCRNNRWPPQVGDPVRGPHIYCKHGLWKIVLTIDPRWITTCHAICAFRSGNHKFAGLCTIKEVRTDDMLMLATPIVIGEPKGRWGDIFR